VPGSPYESELSRRITSDDVEERMPPPDAGPKIADDEIDVLRRWIAAGAKYAQHWSYEAPRRPELPAVSRPDWCRNAIDRFVLAKLDAAGLAPEPEADRYRLIRRLSLDLIGLPPTPEIADKLATELVSELLAEPGCDVVQKLAIPMPMRMIAAILGVPDTDIADFRRWSENSVRIINFSPTPKGVVDIANSMRAVIELRRYFLRHLASGDLKGSNTVLGRLLQYNTEGNLTDDQLFYVALLLLIAGNETTTNLLGGMFDTLAQNPDQYDLIRANPDLIPIAVEEQLRISSPIQNLYRYTRADYQVGEVTIPAGARVLLSFGAANRDPLVFENPDHFDVARANARRNIAFGHGEHFCIGASLARAEARISFERLLVRLDDMRLLDPSALSYVESFIVRGLNDVPMRFRRRS